MSNVSIKSDRSNITFECFREIHKKNNFCSRQLASEYRYLSTPSTEDYPIDFNTRSSKTTFLNRSRKSKIQTMHLFWYLRRGGGYTIQHGTKRDVFRSGGRRVWGEIFYSSAPLRCHRLGHDRRRSEIIREAFQGNSEEMHWNIYFTT